MEYQIKNNLKPKDLKNISNEQIEDHWKLYEGYVTQTNKLNDEMLTLRKTEKSDSLLYADRRRRLGFEYNGMILHEYYFENLSNKKTQLKIDGKLLNTIKKHFESFLEWRKDFILTGKTRGIGWTILYADPKSGNLINTFIAEHEIGHIAGYKPILVMDIWEHAYMVDHKASGRSDYIEAFLENVNWQILEERYKEISK